MFEFLVMVLFYILSGCGGMQGRGVIGVTQQATHARKTQSVLLTL